MLATLPQLLLIFLGSPSSQKNCTKQKSVPCQGQTAYFSLKNVFRLSVFLLRDNYVREEEKENRET